MESMLDDSEAMAVPMCSSATGVQPQVGFCTSGAVAILARNPRWYAVLIRSGQEERASKELRKQGFEVFCPLVPRPERPRDRKAVLAAIARASGKRVRGRPPKVAQAQPPGPKLVAVLRGYVFVCVDLRRDNWSTIRSTRGVASTEERSVFLCMREGEPFPIPARQVQAMQDEVMRFGKAADLVKALMRAGEVVRVSEGPFASFPGRVLRQEGDDVWLEVTIFGRATPVQLKLGQVERSA